MIQLYGFGDAKTDETVGKLVDGLLAKSPSPSPDELAAFLKLLSGEERDAATRILITRGVHPMVITTAQAQPREDAWATAKRWAPIVASATAAIHGYRRNQSLLWALWWGVWGSLFPLTTSAISVAQGWGQRKGA